MKKFNNRGFLLVETLIVATFCLTVLVILFLQFKNLIISYNNSYKYNTVEGIYNLNAVKRYLTQNNFNSSTSYEIITEIDTLSNKIKCKDKYNFLENGISKNNNYCDKLVDAGGFKTIIYTSSAISPIKGYLQNNPNDVNFNEGLRNFIEQLNNDAAKTKRLIAEFNNGTYASITY